MKKNKIMGCSLIVFIVVLYLLRLLTVCSALEDTVVTDLENIDYDPLFHFKKGDKWGYIDKNGSVRISPVFDLARSFSEGFAVVGFINEEMEDEYIFGFINKNGEFIFGPQQVSMICPFSDGLALVEEYTSHYFYINSKGEKVLNFISEYAGSFSEGLAPKEENGKTGYINKKGEWIILPKYWTGYSFSDGLALVRDYYSKEYGYIDREGNEIIPPQYTSARDFSDGVAMIYEGTNIGYINKSGEIIIEPSKNIGRYSEGLITVHEGNMYGFMDLNKTIVIPPILEQASFFTEGLAYARINRKYGYINKDGEIVITPMFDDCEPFHNGLARVMIKDKMAFIDTTGRIVFEY